MTSSITFRPCMGGWCHLRERCPHYDAEFRGNPSERLCIHGRDGVMQARVGTVNVDIAMPASYWAAVSPPAPNEGRSRLRREPFNRRPE